MKRGAIVSLLVALSAVGGLAFIFVKNASPYATIVQLTDSSQGAHVVGQLVPGSLKQTTMSREVNFTLKDDTGTIDVLYKGPPQSNLANATSVVVIGKKENGILVSEKMLVKCPSKYEGEQKAEAK